MIGSELGISTLYELLSIPGAHCAVTDTPTAVRVVRPDPCTDSASGHAPAMGLNPMFGVTETTALHHVRVVHLERTASSPR